MRVQSLGWEDPLEEEMATHYSFIAWRIPWTEDPGGLHSIGSQRVGHDRSNLARTAHVNNANHVRNAYYASDIPLKALLALIFFNA